MPRNTDVRLNTNTVRDDDSSVAAGGKKGKGKGENQVLYSFG
jgi:hypothetical protein